MKQNNFDPLDFTKEELRMTQDKSKEELINKLKNCDCGVCGGCIFAIDQLLDRESSLHHSTCNMRKEFGKGGCVCEVANKYEQASLKDRIGELEAFIRLAEKETTDERDAVIDGLVQNITTLTDENATLKQDIATLRKRVLDKLDEALNLPVHVRSHETTLKICEATAILKEGV